MKKDLNKIAQLLHRVKGETELPALLEDLLTPEEISSISQRIDLVSMLSAGMPQREIAEKLDCGIATVTRGSRIYKHGTGALKKYLPLK